MTDAPLTAAELREALALVLQALRGLPRDRWERAERLGWVQAHIQTILGDSQYGTEPIYGLRALRRGQESPRRVSPEASGRALRLRQEEL